VSRFTQANSTGIVGRERANVRGVRFGRKPSSHQRCEAIERLDAGDAVMVVVRSSRVDRATLYRMKAEASGQYPSTFHPTAAI
jgi:hypothetical protein